MPTLRERQKRQRRHDIMEAARTLFIERGYGKTTMDAIAERAQVGVATVYTHFSTKEGVFAALARRDMAQLRDEGEAILAAGVADPVATVLALIDIYARAHTFISYEVMHDFNVATQAPGPLRDAALWVGDWMRDQIAQALQRGQMGGTIASDLPLNDAALIVADLLLRYYERASTAERGRQALETLRRCVRLLFADWRTPS